MCEASFPGDEGSFLGGEASFPGDEASIRETKPRFRETKPRFRETKLGTSLPRCASVAQFSKNELQSLGGGGVWFSRPTAWCPQARSLARNRENSNGAGS